MRVSAAEPDIDEFMLIPRVTKRKKMDNSKGLFTGCLNLTIDRAPTIPRDNAIFPEIALVMINDVEGNRKQVSMKLLLAAHLWPLNIRE